MATRFLRSTSQVPATRPFTRNVARTRRFFVNTAPLCLSAITRERSLWASSRLSNSGRKRGGASASSGPRRVGQVEQLAAALVLEAGELGPQPVHQRLAALEAGPGLEVRGRRRAEARRGSGAQAARAPACPSAACRSRSRRGRNPRPSESPSDPPRARGSAAAPSSPRAAARGRPRAGDSLWSVAHSSLNGCGLCFSSFRASGRISSMARPSARSPSEVTERSSIGSSTGRKAT